MQDDTHPYKSQGIFIFLSEHFVHCMIWLAYPKFTIECLEWSKYYADIYRCVYYFWRLFGGHGVLEELSVDDLKNAISNEKSYDLKNCNEGIY